MAPDELRTAVSAVREYLDSLYRGWPESRILDTFNGPAVLGLRPHLHRLDGPAFDGVVAAQVLERARDLVEGSNPDPVCGPRGHHGPDGDARLLEAATRALRAARSKAAGQTESK